jgi:hypothetical protein
MKNKVLTGITVLVIAAFTLAACATPTAPAAPTADANAVYTQAAATVAVGLTQTAEKNPPPTATTAPPTTTPTMVAPTATQGNATQAATATQASGAVQATATTASGTTPVPTATKASAPAPTTGDKAEWVSQSPVDSTKIQKNATFNVTFVLKNTGTTTWTTKYAFRFYGGDQLDAPNDLNLTKEVKPGESAEILFTLIAPSSPKITNTVWVLSNADGANFYNVFLKLEITE